MGRYSRKRENKFLPLLPPLASFNVPQYGQFCSDARIGAGVEFTVQGLETRMVDVGTA